MRKNYKTKALMKEFILFSGEELDQYDTETLFLGEFYDELSKRVIIDDIYIGNLVDYMLCMVAERKIPWRFFKHSSRGFLEKSLEPFTLPRNEEIASDYAVRVKRSNTPDVRRDLHDFLSALLDRPVDVRPTKWRKILRGTSVDGGMFANNKFFGRFATKSGWQEFQVEAMASFLLSNKSPIALIYIDPRTRVERRMYKSLRFDSQDLFFDYEDIDHGFIESLLWFLEEIDESLKTSSIEDKKAFVS